MNTMFSTKSLCTKFIHKYDINLYKMISDEKIIEHLDEILLDYYSDDEFMNEIEEFDKENYEKLMPKIKKEKKRHNIHV